MNDAQLEALCSAVETGVEFDGLRVGRDGDGYFFRVPGVDREALSIEQFRSTARENPWYVSNWHFWTHVVDGRLTSSAGGGTAIDGGTGVDADRADADGADADGVDADRADADRVTHRYAFLRWLERADRLSVPERYEALSEDLTKQWGQLSIIARVGADGGRRYELRHLDDEATERPELVVKTDHRELRELVKFDARGRYRPLKTAPTLPDGWMMTELDGADLVRAVDTVYPATIVNWHLEHRGELDVSHWEETAARQTGIYGVVEELPDEALDWVAESCCVDSQCLKRRRWDRSGDEEIDVSRGEHAFPCREPCSLVVAAARKWTKLEDEPTRSYEFELTPSEKEQLEALVEAVADGRIDEIREADVYDGANRYRARYLRAKRFEDGQLSGTPTDREE